jgi:hypothetical protein
VPGYVVAFVETQVSQMLFFGGDTWTGDLVLLLLAPGEEGDQTPRPSRTPGLFGDGSIHWDKTPIEVLVSGATINHPDFSQTRRERWEGASCPTMRSTMLSRREGRTTSVYKSQTL